MQSLGQQILYKEKVYEYYETMHLQLMLKLDFYKALEAGYIIRKCENCERYSLLQKGYHTKYCDLPNPANPKYTCAQLGYRLRGIKEDAEGSLLAQAGESDAFERLHKQLANFIRPIALESCRHFGCTDVVFTPLLEDLRAEGGLELWERIHNGGYDERVGKLTTYLYPFLRGRMYRYLETNLGVMSLSKDDMERVRRCIFR